MKHGRMCPKEGQIVGFIVSDDAECPDIRENDPVWPKCRTMLGDEHGLPNGLRQHDVSGAGSLTGWNRHRHASALGVCWCMGDGTSPRLNQEDRIGGMWGNDMEADGEPGEGHRRRHGW